MDSCAIIDAFEKRKISYPRREAHHDSLLVVQFIA
jgi:hypothetical protein